MACARFIKDLMTHDTIHTSAVLVSETSSLTLRKGDLIIDFLCDLSTKVFTLLIFSINVEGINYHSAFRE
jgi:hypothetical protein